MPRPTIAPTIAEAIEAVPPRGPAGIRAVAGVLAAGCLTGLLLGATPLRAWAEGHEAPEPVLAALRAWEAANPLSPWFEAVRAAVETAQRARF